MNDGVALNSIRHPVLITEEMLTAGLAVVKDKRPPIGFTWRELVCAIYSDMLYAAPEAPDDINPDALETVTKGFSRASPVLQVGVSVCHQMEPLVKC